MLNKVLCLLFVLLFCTSAVVFAAESTVSTPCPGGDCSGTSQAETNAAGARYLGSERLVEGGGGTSGRISVSGTGCSDCPGTGQIPFYSANKCILTALGILIFILAISQIYTSMILRKIYKILKEK